MSWKSYYVTLSSDQYPDHPMSTGYWMCAPNYTDAEKQAKDKWALEMGFDKKFMKTYTVNKEGTPLKM